MKKKRSSKDFFMEIWGERAHRSEVSDTPLGEEPMAYFFSHVCGKGAHPSLKFEKRNIILMTLEEHREWEFGSPSGKMWDWVYERKDQMRKLSALNYK